MIWNVPAHDPRIRHMTPYEFELEVVSYYEGRKILAELTAPTGKPKQDFLDRVKKLQERADAGEPVTIEELGWDKHDGA